MEDRSDSGITTIFCPEQLYESEGTLFFFNLTFFIFFFFPEGHVGVENIEN